MGTVRIRRGIFKEDSLSTLLFVLALTPMSLVLREVKTVYQLGDLQGKVNHLLFIDDLKLYGQKEKQIDTLVNTALIFNEDFGMELGISKCPALIMKRDVISKSKGMQLTNDEFIKLILKRERDTYT